MKEHTPGPWFVVWDEEGDDDIGGYGTYCASEIVSGSPESNDYVDLMSNKNAPLIAAAPTMLDALRYCADQWDLAEANYTINRAEMRKIVEAAIAKATECPPGRSTPLPHSNK